MYDIIQRGVQNPHHRAYTTNDEDDTSLLAEFELELGDGFGITVCGQFDENDEFFPEYYYPYLDSGIISTSEQLSVESRVDNNTYAGECDDLRLGVTLIFRVRNAIEYRKNLYTSFLPLEHTTVTLTALSTEGSVMLPIYKTPDDLQMKKNTELKRRRLLNAARNGDEKAVKDLTISEMDVYSNLLSQIQYEDVYTLVESYFMPYGAECELYSVMGEITAVDYRFNNVTEDQIIVLSLQCNGLPLDIAINHKDLYGDPQPGRRFKGVIWLQGKINFPLSSEFPELKKTTDGNNQTS